MIDKERLIPGTGAWWEKWSPIWIQLLQLHGFQVAAVRLVSIQAFRHELIDLLRSAASRAEFWEEVRAEIDQTFGDGEALRQLLQQAHEGIDLLPETDDVPKREESN